MCDLFKGFKTHRIICVPDQLDVDQRLKSHVDLSVFVGNDFIVAHKSVYDAIRLQLIESLCETWVEKHLIKGHAPLGRDYPNDIPYNALQLKEHFFHKIDKTETEILEKMSCEHVNVKQGYTRCSTLKIDEKSVITEDLGLYKHFRHYGYDVLLIQKGHIELEGFPYGFFGGTAARVKDEILFNGALVEHPNRKAIIEFIEQRGLRIRTLHSGKLIDCGSFHYFDAIS